MIDHDSVLRAEQSSACQGVHGIELSIQRAWAAVTYSVLMTVYLLHLPSPEAQDPNSHCGAGCLEVFRLLRTN